MIINLTSDNFTLDTGNYYSSPFKQDTNDTFLSIGVTLGVNGDASLQSSIDETNWDDVTDSTFTCDPFGLQSYTNGHSLLVYRIKTTQAVVSAKIVI